MGLQKYWVGPPLRSPVGQNGNVFGSKTNPAYFVPWGGLAGARFASLGEQVNKGV